LLYRPSEVESLHGDSTRARTKLGWQPKYDLDSILDEMIEEEKSKQSKWLFIVIKMSKSDKSSSELRNMLRAKIGEKRIQRSSKQNRENILDKTLKDIGIDKEKFKKDLEEVKKQGGLEMNLSQN